MASVALATDLSCPKDTPHAPFSESQTYTKRGPRLERPRRVFERQESGLCLGSAATLILRQDDVEKKTE